jgi:hypothetical protein
MGTQLLKNGKQLNLKALKKYVQSDVAAKKEYNKGIGVSVVSYLFAYAGGTVIGYDLGTAIRTSDNIHPATIITGLALVGISIPFALNADKHFGKAAALYNKSRRKTGSLYPGTELRFITTGNTVGLQYCFR